MLAGQAPFTGPTVESIVHQHLMANPPPITQLRPAVPAEVAAALQRALAKTPADRFNPVAQFASALQPRAAAATAPVVAPAARASRALLIGGSLVALAVVAFAFLRSPGGGTDALPVIGRTMQVTRDPGLEVDPALSPDGQSIAYAAGPTTAMQVYVRQVSGGRPVALTSDTTGQFPLAPLVARRIPDRLPGQRRHLRRASARRRAAPRRARHAPALAGQPDGARPSQGFDWSPDGSRGSPGPADTTATGSRC